MGIFDVFKVKQIQGELDRAKSELEVCRKENLQLQQLLSPEHKEVIKLKQEIEQLQGQKESLIKETTSVEASLAALRAEVAEQKKKIIIFDEEELVQSFGLYTPMYNLTSSEEYKMRLEMIRSKQKEMVKDKSAVSYSDAWTVDGSKAKGQKMTNDNIKQILRSFNNECEAIINKVKFNNIEAIEQRINKAFEQLNKLNETNKVSIQRTYLDLKLEELHLSYEYEQKKQEEKEEQQRIREQMREEQKVQQEIERVKQKIEKEEKHFQQAIQQLEVQLEVANEDQKRALEQKMIELKNGLQALEKDKQDVENREKNTRAGYVYVISNIGSFGENVFKIGMTRRLEPVDRVKELGDASVPFIFDIHALIFSDDAPSLENNLHKYFEAKRVNKVNLKKEFFRVTLAEIEAVVKQHHNAVVEFTKLAQAADYRETLKINERIKIIA